MLPSFLLVAAAAAIVGCAGKDKPDAAVVNDSAPAPAPAASAASADAPDAAPTGNATPVRGTVASVSDSVLTVASPSGAVRVTLEPPVKMYAIVPAKLSQVKENSFVGVTSMAQPDGSQRATQINIFPEELRGTSEGSFLMQDQGGGAAGGGSRMTNGTVAAPRMTNGTVAAPRMTNGTISGQSGSALTVRYQGYSRTIAVPPDVSVTAIAPTQAKLTTGANVVVVATKQPDGTLRASSVLLANRPGSAKK